MPRPKREGGPEPKKRSRHGCWPCKARKVKCGEEKPQCLNCQRQGEACDYSIRLNWDGRSRKKGDSVAPGSQPLNFDTAEASSSFQAAQAQYNVASESPTTDVSRGDVTSTFSREGSVAAQIADPGVSRLPEYGPSGFRSTEPMYSMQPGMTAMPPMQTWPDPSNIGQMETHQLPGFSMLPQMHQEQMAPYLSPGDAYGGSAYGGMPPPFPSSTQGPSLPGQVEAVTSPSNAAKRVRLSPSRDIPGAPPPPRLMRRSSSFGPGDLDEVQRPTSQPLTPTLTAAHYPHTSTASSSASDESRARWSSRPMAPPMPTEREIRRVSVNSLLSTSSPEPEDKTPPGGSSERPPSSSRSEGLRSERKHSDTYGFDRGQPDLDIPKNNDIVAISAVTPSEPGSDVDSWLQGFDALPEFAFGLQKRERVFAKGGYYAQTVPIRIPKSLEPLPATLIQNPMNLLYFHHFLNHTARILVPHDCSENPFKTILPQMAVENINLLNLLLAYSASHRARLLHHPEPANRIAHWVRDVFPSLRHALDSLSLSNTQISNVNLATAIMLSSLEIISPSTFGISVPWQTHLGIAREIIHARYSAPQSISRDDPVPFFLSRWFAYLDVLGSLSGRTNQLPLFSGDHWAHSSSGKKPATETDEDYLIDCLLGMTPRCLVLLAQIASLARECDNERISSTTGHADPDWKPSPAVQARAESLRDDVDDARTHMNRPCPHRHSLVEYSPTSSPAAGDPAEGVSTSDTLADPSSIMDTSTTEWDNLELLSCNDSFHLAALIHLHRRILFLPRSSPVIQSLVHAIVSNMYKVRKGGSAEACLLFPMFTAGCEALEDGVRGVILERVSAIEDVGMMQVTAARRLMERVWKESHEGKSPTVLSPSEEAGEEKLATAASEVVGSAPPEQPTAELTEQREEESQVRTQSRKRKRERGWEEFLGGAEFFG